MSAGNFDDHIAAMGALVISEDYSKFNKCYDRIKKSIMDLNARKLTMSADDYIAAIGAANISED